jgi:hypothetical protein
MKITNHPIIEREDCKRYIRTIEDECVSNDADRLKRKFDFLISIVNDGIYSGILHCGPVTFDTLHMFFNQSKLCWTIKLEAEIKE